MQFQAEFFQALMTLNVGEDVARKVVDALEADLTRRTDLAVDEKLNPNVILLSDRMSRLAERMGTLEGQIARQDRHTTEFRWKVTTALAVFGSVLVILGMVGRHYGWW